MANNDLEKKIIPFEKILHKKDIKRLLSHLSDDVSYEMVHLGNLINGVDKSIQNECSGTIACKGTRMAYGIHIHTDGVYRMRLYLPQRMDKEILNIMERKIAEFFLTYPTNISCISH